MAWSATPFRQTTRDFPLTSLPKKIKKHRKFIQNIHVHTPILTLHAYRERERERVWGCEVLTSLGERSDEREAVSSSVSSSTKGFHQREESTVLVLAIGLEEVCELQRAKTLEETNVLIFRAFSNWRRESGGARGDWRALVSVWLAWVVCAVLRCWATRGGPGCDVQVHPTTIMVRRANSTGRVYPVLGLVQIHTRLM